MRTVPWFAAVASLSVGCATVGAAASPAASRGDAAGSITATDAEKLVITGEITAVTDDVAGLVAAIGTHATEIGGAVAREEVGGEGQHRQASVTLRLPPPALVGFVAWVSTRAVVQDRHIEATDVAREYVDRDLAIRNLEITMGRLQELARRPNAELKDIITVEHEMTRVRGEIEKLRSAQRLRDDQIARATLAIAVRTAEGVHVEPQAKFELIARLSVLHLADPAGRSADRIGFGVSTMFARWFSLELEMFPGREGGARSYLFTMGTAMYSDFLGGGRRRFGNPFLGLRVGGASLDGANAFAYGAEAGVELVRLPRLLVEMSGRLLGLRYDGGRDAVLEATLGIGIPF